MWKSSAILRILLIYFQLILESASQNGICRFQEFRCVGGTKCLLSEKLCNGVEDCPTGEDESGSEQWDCSRTTLGTSSQCGDPRKFFKCRFGGCVSRRQVCDGIVNCWGGTDEALDLCGSNKAIVDVPVTAATTERIRTRPTTTTEPVRRPPPPPKQRPHNTRITTRRPAALPSGSCPPIQVVEGETVVCYHAGIGQVIDCRRKPSPKGTVAKTKCAKFWSPPLTGSRVRRRICRGGSWAGGNRRFQCQLDCGEGGNPPAALVVGGFTSAKGKWPWHVGLYESEAPGSKTFSNVCGATLISPNAVITAGHCVTTRGTNSVKSTRSLVLHMGKFYRAENREERYVQSIKPHKIVLHPHYKYNDLDSDIAIIFLEKRVKITAFVHPVCLPPENDELTRGMKGTLVGWGSAGDGTYPEELQETELPFIPSSTCRASHPALSKLVRQTNFCAGYRNGTSACDGDSGSGLVFRDPNNSSKWYIGGVVSGGVPPAHGRNGCDPRHYVAFSYVSKFTSWIYRELDNEDFIQ